MRWKWCQVRKRRVLESLNGCPCSGQRWHLTDFSFFQEPIVIWMWGVGIVCNSSTREVESGTQHIQAQPDKQQVYLKKHPTSQPANQPASQPAIHPTNQESNQQRNQPTHLPRIQPTNQTRNQPTNQPRIQPTKKQTNQTTKNPTNQPTIQPKTLSS